MRSIILLIIIFVSIACNKKNDNNEKNNSILNTLNAAEQNDEKFNSKPYLETINYQKIYIKNNEELNNIFSPKGIGLSKEKVNKILITLNRKEKRFFKVGDSIIIPDRFIDNILAYSIFPQEYNGAKNLPKLIVVSNKYQSYACYENGKLIRFAAANTGKETTPTFPGRYSINWKAKNHRSSLDSTWVMPNTVNFHLQAGSAFHQFSMPGRPVSHSCVRQFYDDSEWLFNWVTLAKRDTNKKFIEHSGTPVIIIDYFDFNRKKYGPWLDIPSNQFIVELPDNPMDIEEALIPIKQIPHGARGSLKNKERFVYAEDTLKARGVIRSHIKLRESVNFNQLRRQKQAKQNS